MHYEYEYTFAEWLSRRFKHAVEIDWEQVEDTTDLDRLLAPLVVWSECDGLDLGDLSTEDWLALRRGEGQTSLAWFLRNFRRVVRSSQSRLQLYNQLDLPLEWHLGGTRDSRTLAGVPGLAPFVHTDGLHRETPDLHREVRRPLRTIEVLPPARARRVIHVARAALATRHRSFYPFENPNPHEVIRADVGRGYEIFLLGVHPEVRLPLETDYGGLILKNGHVFGYAVGALLFDQIEIAVNIYDTWRGGEAKYVFCQFMRTFRSHFGCRHFKIEKYQVGYENEEGLQSGSFWFYHNLGFVPAVPEVRELAARERAKVRRDRSYRSPRRVLLQLARSDQYFTLGRPGHAAPQDFPVAALGLAVTRRIGEAYGGDGAAALQACRARIARVLRCDWRRWPRWEREWFGRLALVVSLIPDLARWSAAERRALRELMRAKGASGEADYVRRLARHTRLRRALLRIARQEAARAAP
jgi:hypothetical protein